MPISRRHLVQGTAATALLGSALPTAFAKAPLQNVQAPGFYRYSVGALEVTAIQDGFFQRPLEGLVRNVGLETVQSAAGAAFMATDRLTIPFTTSVVNTGDRLVLLDAGNGNSGPATTGLWMTNFRAAGFSPEQVDTVVLSHFHGDHINGLRLRDGAAVFPNAEVMVPAAEWGFWMDDAKLAGALDGLKANFNNVRRVFGPIAKHVTPYAPGREVAPGVTAVAAPGHTPGHTAFAVASGSGRLLVMSDTTNHPALFVRNPDWQAVVDMDGDAARDTRRRLLDMAASEKMQVAFYHAPFPATGFIARSGSGFELVPQAWNPAV